MRAFFFTLTFLFFQSSYGISGGFSELSFLETPSTAARLSLDNLRISIRTILEAVPWHEESGTFYFRQEDDKKIHNCSANYFYIAHNFISEGDMAEDQLIFSCFDESWVFRFKRHKDYLPMNALEFLQLEWISKLVDVPWYEIFVEKDSVSIRRYQDSGGRDNFVYYHGLGSHTVKIQIFEQNYKSLRVVQSNVEFNNILAISFSVAEEINLIGLPRRVFQDELLGQSIYLPEFEQRYVNSVRYFISNYIWSELF